MARETEVERLLVRLIGDATQYQKMLLDVKTKTKRTMKDVGQSMSRIGRSLSLRLTAPLVAMGAAATMAFARFDKAMTESTSIMKVTADQTARMRDLALELSTTGVQGPTDLANAYFFLASAGKDAEQSMALLPKVMSFATAGAFDMASATDLLTDAQSALGLSTKDAVKDAKSMARVSDVLVKANTLANASVRQFSVSLTSKAGAALKSFNKDVEEGVAVLAALADQGIKAELSGNALDRFIRLLSKSSLDNAKAQQRLGFRVFDNAGKMRNLGDIVKNLEDVLRGMSDQSKVATLDMLGFEARIQAVILPLIGTSDAIKRYESELRKAGGTTEEVAKKQMESFSSQLKMIKNRMNAAAIEIGKMITPALLSWLDKAAGLWESLNGTVKAFIVTVGILTATLGPLLMIGGFLLSNLGLMATAIVTVAGAAKAAMGAFLLWQSAISLTMLGIGALVTVSLVVFIAMLAEATFGVGGLNDQLQKTKDLSEGLLKIWSSQQQAFLQGISQIPTIAGQREAISGKLVETRKGITTLGKKQQDLIEKGLVTATRANPFLQREIREGNVTRAESARGGLSVAEVVELKDVTKQLKNLGKFSQRLQKEFGTIDAEESRRQKQAFRRTEIQAQVEAASKAAGVTKKLSVQEQIAAGIAAQRESRQVQAGIATYNRQQELRRAPLIDPANPLKGLELELKTSAENEKKFREEQLELSRRIAEGVEVQPFEALDLP